MGSNCNWYTTGVLHCALAQVSDMYLHVCVWIVRRGLEKVSSSTLGKKNHPHTGLKWGDLAQFFCVYANALRDSFGNFFLLFFVYIDTLTCIFSFKNSWNNYLTTRTTCLIFLKINNKAIWWLLGETECISP